MHSKGLLVRRNVFTSNSGNRAYGLALTAVDSTRFEDNEITANSVGVHMHVCNGNRFTGNNISRDYIGVRITTSCNDNTFSRNTFTGNLHPVEIDGNSGDNAWAADRVGNRWATGAEIDLNGDGVGDFPHREADLLGNVRRSFPLVGLLSGSPVLDMVRFAQQHAALPKIPAIIDPAPLTPGYGAVSAQHGN
jgi:nitrous oxidase accessory protein